MLREQCWGHVSHLQQSIRVNKQQYFGVEGVGRPLATNLNEQQKRATFREPSRDLFVAIFYVVSS